MTSERPREDLLFGREAVEEQQTRWLGAVLLIPKVSRTISTTVATALVAGVIGLFVFGQYTQKARITGWLAPPSRG